MIIKEQQSVPGSSSYSSKTYIIFTAFLALFALVGFAFVVPLNRPR